MIHIYEGDGKGKTTAAAGLALRAAGHGIPVVFAQFMKNGSSGEIKALGMLPGVRVIMADRFFGFVSRMSEAEKAEIRESYVRLLSDIRTMAFEGISGTGAVDERNEDYECRCLVVLDEVLYAVKYGLVTEELLLDMLDQMPTGVELILTGRDPSAEVAGRADYITHIGKVKHPYDKGLAARAGIEF